jgi:CubicO group peptidase (beta-lactamase class C family)
MKSFVLLLTLILTWAGECSVPAAPPAAHYPGKTWTRVKTPEKLGWSTEKLKAARKYSEANGSTAVMIVVDGFVLDEWGKISTRFNVHSIRKSFLNALIGIAVGEQKINLSSTLEDLGIDDSAPALTSEEKQARVVDLLESRSGVYHPALYESASMKGNRPPRGSHAPGTFWYYNNWDFNVLGTIYERATNSTVFGDFKRLIADPLQMADFRLEDTESVRGGDSIHPAYQFRMTARDMARFGLLFLRRGRWEGKQIVPAEWIAESTRPYTVTHGGDGAYGYLWWVAHDGTLLPNVTLEDGAFAARGAGGECILIVPRLNLVIVHRVDTDEPGAEVSSAQLGKLTKLILDAKK